MKVLHIFNEIKYSGAEIMYANAAPFFQKEGMKLYAMSTGLEIGDFAGEFKKKDIDTYHFCLKPGFLFPVNAISFYIYFYKFIQKNKIEVLHIHRNDLYVVGFIARLAGLKVVKTMHSVFKHRFLTYPYGVLIRFLARKLFRFKFQTIGRSVYEHELNYYHSPSIRINNWYDCERFYEPIDSSEKKHFRKELGLTDDQFVIVSVGNCSHIKNHFEIIKALGLLKEELDFLYLHLGSGHTESDEKELATSLGIDEKTRFLGTQSNIRDYLVASDLYIMTSKLEGLTIAGIEAMGCGAVSILYDSPGLRDLIIDNKNGLLIPQSYKVLASKIMYLKSNSKERERISKNAVSFVKSEFSIQKNVTQIVQLYEGKL